MSIDRAARILRRGGLVAFPTETVYGLGANALDARAVRRIFKVKGRPLRNPLIVHVASIKQASTLVSRLPEEAKRLMRRFWPGPLTIVLPKSVRVPSVTTAGLATVAIRMPNHPLALRLLRRANVPVAAPSANRSGGPSPTTAQHVLEDLGDRVDYVLDGGPTKLGLESTVVDLSRWPPVLLRPGAITAEQLSRVLGVRVRRAPRSRRSPGMRYRHYAPRTPLRFGNASRIQTLLRRTKKSVGLILTRSRGLRGMVTTTLGPALRNVARGLYGAVRELDKRGLDLIVVEAVPERGIGHAIMNRLRKAGKPL